MLRRRQKGAAAVEFALVTIPLLAMVLGVTEYGRALYQYDTIAKAARDASRYLSTKAPGDSDAAARARCLVVFGNETCSGEPRLPGLALDNVQILDASAAPATHKDQSTGGGVVNLVTVSGVGFQFRSLLNLQVGAVNLGAPNITFGPISSTMRQAL